MFSMSLIKVICIGGYLIWKFYFLPNITHFTVILHTVLSGTTPVVSELLYSAANLLVLLNDSILRQAYNIKFRLVSKNSHLLDRLKYPHIGYSVYMLINDAILKEAYNIKFRLGKS